MNILVSSKIYSKFFNDILLVQDADINIYTHNIENQLYRLYSKIKPKFLFVNIFELNEEINQFALEYEHECVVFCYCPDQNYSNHNFNINTQTNIVYLCYTDNAIPERRCLTIPKNIVNKPYLSNLMTASKENNIICFMDTINETYKQNIVSLLYPNNKDLRIRLFNDIKLKHPQNLGFAYHQDKLQLLSKNKYVLCNHGFDYYYESIFLGCKPIHIEKMQDNLVNLVNIIDAEEPFDLSNVHDFTIFFKEMVLK